MNTCGHIDRKHYAKGLCNPCYQRERYIPTDLPELRSCDAVAKELGLSSEMIRLIEQSALRKLRRSVVLRELWEASYEPRPLNGYDGNRWNRART